jgi:Big-like domain-containing protein
MPFGFKLSHRLSRIKLLACAAVLTACEIPTTGPDQTHKLVGRVLVRPDSVTLDPGQTQQFRATGRTTGNDSLTVSVIWSASAGTITQSGLYTADSTTSDAVVTATYSTTSDLTGSSSVKKRRLVAIVLTPASAGVLAGGTQQFTAYGLKNTGDSVAVPVTYTATGGTISGSGFYTAGAVAGAYRVIAKQSNGSLADTSTVTISATTPPPSAAECANPQPGWIWCDDFEQDRLAGYFEYNSDNGSFVRAASVGRGGSYGMRVHFAAGQQSAGALHLAFGKTPDPYIRPVDAGTATYRELYWRMYVMNQPGWTGGGGDKLSRALIFASSTWAEAALAHVWSGSGSDANYLVLDPASGTDLQGNLVTTQYNDFANLRWLGATRSGTPLFDAAHVGAWHCIEAHARLNDPNQSNGVFELWMDGALNARETSLNWVGTYGQYGFNAVFFENYWNAGSPQAQDRYFDDIVVSTAPIGCGDAALPPPGPTPVASVSVSPAVDTVGVGLTRQLTTVTKDAAGNVLTGRVVTWTSGNPAVATVSANGLVTAVAPGSVTVTATSEGVNGTSTTTVAVVLAAIVQVSPASDTLLPGQTATLTATARDKNGNMLSGRTITWTSLSPAVASVSASGVVTGLATGSATIRATVDTANGAAAVAVDPTTSPAPVPWLLEDFSTYTSTSNWLSDPRGIYSVPEDEATGQMTLDGVGVNVDGYSLTKAARYDYVAPGCASQTVARNLKLPATVKELWLEVYVKFSTNFTTQNVNGCSTPPDFKMLFARINELVGRGAVRWGSQTPPQVTVELGPNVDLYTGVAISTYSDNRWHRLRVHWRISDPNSAIQVRIDGVTVYNRTNFSVGGTDPRFYGIAIGRNLDQGVPSGTMSEWWGRIAAFNSNPGWTF